MTRRSMHLAVFALTLILLANAAWTSAAGVDITGNFFNPKPGSTTLCAKVDPMGLWAVSFTGETPYDLVFGASPLVTDPTGKGCLKMTWPQGVYAVEATANRLTTTLESEEVAVSVFNPNSFCGAQGGGALKLSSYDVPPNVKKTLASRQATFAFILKQNVPQNRGVFFFDHDNPIGDVEFVAQSFTNTRFLDQVDGLINYKSAEAVGNGFLSIEPDFYRQPVHYYLYADNYPNSNWFQIEMFDFAGKLLYRSASDDDEAGMTVLNGKNMVLPCP